MCVMRGRTTTAFHPFLSRYRGLDIECKEDKQTGLLSLRKDSR